MNNREGNNSMKNGIGIKIVLAVGFLFSIISIIEGTSVLLGMSTPGYFVVPALLYYNILFAIVGLGASIGLWLRTQWSVRSAVTIALFHSIVLILVTVFHFVDGTFAIDSVRAMTIRSILWIAISFVTVKARSTIVKSESV